MTAVVTDRTASTDTTTLQEAARNAFRDSGGTLVGRELGKQFGRSERWGRDRIAEVNRETGTELRVSPPPAPAPARRDRGRRLRGRRVRQSRRPRMRPPHAEDAAQELPAAPAEAAIPPATVKPSEEQVVGGKTSSWLAFLTGILVSISANMLHAHVDGGPTSLAELIGAAFWPVALLLALEVLTRVPWPPAFWWWGFARYVGIGLVAAVAFVLSYRHMAGLLTSWGEDWWNAHIGPLAVDGLMLISATALLAISRARNTK